MNFMECQGCKGLVQANPTGQCLGCQRGFMGTPQEDSFDNVIMSKLKLKEKELEDAIQEQESKKMDVCQHTEDGPRVGKGNPKRQKTTKKSKEDKKN